jgi:hypothetical protein
MHDAGVSQAPDGSPGAVAIAPDGSVAALVPAHRALSWHLTDQDGNGVVRERNWLSFPSGEIRVCANCHGINTLSQTGDPEPVNEPQALRELLALWKREHAGGTATPTVTPTPTATPTPTPGNAVCDSGIVIERAALRVKSRPPTLTLSGRALIPKPWSDVAPHVNGVRITLHGMFDVTVPGGIGWTVGEDGDRWTFNDRTGQFGGIRRIDIADRSTLKPGLLVFSVRIAGMSYVAAPGTVDISIRFGDAHECATKQWNKPGTRAARCQGRLERLRCR